MNKVLRRIGIIAVALYAIYILIAQQKSLNTYAREGKEYSNQIEIEKQIAVELNTTLQSLNSTEYIEDIARDKLDMYLPNERVYIDITK